MELSSEEMSNVIEQRLKSMPYQTKFKEEYILDYEFGFSKVNVDIVRPFGPFSKYKVSNGEYSVVGWLLISSEEIIWVDKNNGPVTIVKR